ncbi:MAG: Rrf2 family transcriptional regulator [Candidatus Sabulitectum sp.]|nr:Rrf2 family transcriptional regulator [Candidatus Sabulitectum sp.]
MKQVLRISEAASIAMHALIFLAEKKGESISNTRIAEVFGISANHSSKVMQRLLKSGYVRALRGPGGGYTLLAEPAKVSLLDICTTVDGELDTSGCLFGRKKRCSLKKCLFSGLMSEADDLIVKHLGSVTLADFIKDGFSFEGIVTK